MAGLRIAPAGTPSIIQHACSLTWPCTAWRVCLLHLLRVPLHVPLQGPCQHNFCLACFKRWLAQGKKTCPTCRTPFPNKFIENPRINTLLTYAIRCAKQGIKSDAAKTYNRIADESR